MKIELSEELKELARALPGRLYVVGGAVRDMLLGFEPQDYDLAASCTSGEVIEALKSTRFRAEHNSLKLGTLSIRGNSKYEYTAFRTDSYTGNGRHAPTKVEFVKDIAVDARRRDFTVNAIYLDVATGKIEDPTGGVNDLESKLIRTVRDPYEVIKEDALRIMRLARFACSLGFAVPLDVLKACKARAATLAEIAPERIRVELEKILIADTVYGVKGAHIRGLELLREIGATEVILPEVYNTIGVKQNPKYHKYDVYGHTLHTVQTLPPELRMVGLLHDIGKPDLIKCNGKASGHEVPGARMAQEILERLHFSKNYVKRTVSLVRNHMFDVDGKQTDTAVREFVQAGYDEIEDLVKLKIADWSASGLRKGVSPSAMRLERVYREMKAEGVPFEIKDLPVKGEDLERYGVPPCERGKLLKTLLKMTANDKSLRRREGALSYIEEYAKRI